MTKSYIVFKEKRENVYGSWEESLIPPKYDQKLYR